MATLAELQQYANDSANAYGVPPALLTWQLGQESSWNSNAGIGTAHVGLGQFDAPTWSRFGVGSRTDPYASIDAAAAYDSWLYGKFGDWTKVMQSYGTLANVPQKVWDSFNKVMGGGAVDNSTTTGSGSTSNFSPDSFLTRAAFMLLGVVVIAGAIFVYRR